MEQNMEPSPPEPVIENVSRITDHLFQAQIDGITHLIPTAPSNREWELIRGYIDDTA